MPPPSATRRLPSTSRPMPPAITVRQLVAANGKPAPAISGTMLFGSGSDTLDVADGTVSGAAKFGLGNNQLKLSGDASMTGAVSFGGGSDSVQLGGTSILTGNVDFGGGADSLTLAGTSAFHGASANSAGLAVNVGAGSTLDVTNIGTVDLASLTTGAGSTHRGEPRPGHQCRHALQCRGHGGLRHRHQDRHEAAQPRRRRGAPTRSSRRGR